jgi:hypothetical protein
VLRGDGAPVEPRVAVCSLTSRELVEPLGDLQGVAMTGTLMTANLGIEQLIRTLWRRPSIIGLLVCGRDSPTFRAGQSLVALFRQGVDPDSGRIREASGYLPLLRSVSVDQVEDVRSRVELVDARGERNVQVLRDVVESLVARTTCPPADRATGEVVGPRRVTESPCRRLRPGGRRMTLEQGIDGFVVITLDHERHRILLRHYDSELTPRHEMWGNRAESMLLGLLRAGVIDDPSHAGYLGGELTKAETALRLGLRYEQDLPLRAPRPR